jgi:hypothetical protein
MGVLRTVVNLALPVPVVRWDSKKERTAKAAERSARALEKLVKKAEKA